MQSHFADRDDMNAVEFHAAYYSDCGVGTQFLDEILTFIANEISVPKEKIRPGDRFAVELAPARWNDWDSGYGILLYALQRQAKKSGVVLKNRIETVDDYIRATISVCPHAES